MAVNKHKVLFRSVFLLVVLFTVGGKVMGQANYLNRRVSLSFSEITLAEALAEISEKAGVNFSYNAKIIDRNKRVSINEQKITVSKALDALLGKNIRYKISGHHIILLRKVEVASGKKEMAYFTLSGIITDLETKQRIENVSVYNVGNMNSTITGNDGSYSLRFVSSGQVWAVNYSRRGYFDTTVFFNAVSDKEVSLSLVPVKIKMEKVYSKNAFVQPSSFSELELVNRFVSREAIVNAENIKIQEKRLAQVSFLPYLGSNAKVSGTMSNNFSFNVLSGFSGAVNGFEIGAVLNITKRHVNGAQISGFGNITGDYSRGVQIAGFLNKTTGTLNGVQIAGFNNLVLDTVNGVQVAGFSNILKGRMNGVQISGFNNLTTEHVDGLQLTGFLNISRKDVKLGQVSGFMNVCDNVDGFQLAGFLNVADGNVKLGQMSGFMNFGDDVDGFQLAGFFNMANGDVRTGQFSGFMNRSEDVNGVQLSGSVNIANDVKGAQLSGLINIADTVKGVQFGLINICDTSSGVSLGFFSHVKKGYRSVQLSANGVFPVNIAYKTGTHKFYNIFSFGAGPTKLYPWSLGFGFGARKKLKKKFSLDFELTANRTFEEEMGEEELNLLNKFETILNYKLAKHMTLSAGPSVNVHVSSVKNSEGEFITDIAVNPFFERASDKTQVQMWIGGKVGLSF